jgi:hypothetical protein
MLIERRRRDLAVALLGIAFGGGDIAKTSSATYTASFLTKYFRRMRMSSVALASAMKTWFSAGVTIVKAEP